MLALPFRRPLLSPQWALNDLWRRAKAKPSLDLDFASVKTLTDRVTGRQLVDFTRASSGTYVGSDGLIKTATTNEARFDHNPTTGESLGLLVEEQRTNLVLYSEQFDNGYWAKANINGTLNANQITAPDETITADLYQEDTANFGRYLGRAISVVSGTLYTVSIWAKQYPGATRYAGLILPTTGFGTNAIAIYTLSGSGSFNITSSATNTSASIQAFPNNWYRCILTSQATATVSSTVQIRLSNISTGIAAYTGDGASGIYLWGAQVEAGSFPTSYIPTTTAAVTRSADVASITGANFSSWYWQDEGTVFAESRSNASTGDRGVFSINASGSSNNRIDTRLPNRSIVSSGGSLVAVMDTSASMTAQALFKTAVGAKLDNFARVTNAGNAATDTSGAMPVGNNQIEIGCIESNQTHLNGTIRRLTYWPSRLPNATLQQITQ